mgnify:CR=1 FL=1
MNYAPNNGCDDCAFFSEGIEETAYCGECGDVMGELKEYIAFAFAETTAPRPVDPKFNGAKITAKWLARWKAACAELKELEG